MAETKQDGAQDPKFIKYLLDPKEEYNCYFLVGNSELSEPERIGVVKKMLLAHSLVFRRELQESHIKEKAVVQISDMFPDTFKNLLRFVYGFDNTATLCFDEADNLFYASEKYMITGLKARLATRLIQLLTPDNICSLMKNPACSSELRLNSAITHILQSETGRVLSTPQFLDLTGTAFNRILEQEALSVPEIELWRAALKWAKHKTGSEDGAVLRKQLTEQTKHIRICSLSNDELCREVIPTGMMSSEELRLICQSGITKEKPEGLVNLCKEIKPRKRLYRTNVTLNLDLQNHLQASECNGNNLIFTIITKIYPLELFPFEFTANTFSSVPEVATYQCDCTIKITRITDYVNNTSNRRPVTVLFNQQVEYGKQFVVPVINMGQNVILRPESKYVIRVAFTSLYKMYRSRNNPTFNNDHLSIDFPQTFSGNTPWYYTPIKILSYRPVMAGSEDGAVLRKQLTEQTKHIRICSLSNDELCREVIPTGMMSSEELRLICQSGITKEKPEGLVNLCKEIKPRKRLYRTNVTLNLDLQNHLQASECNGNSLIFTIITKKYPLELFPFEFTANTFSSVPEVATYQCDCTIKITRITDYVNNTSNRRPVTVLFNQQVEYGKQFVVPVINMGQNVILRPESKYVIRVAFTSLYKMYRSRNNPIFNNDHLSIDFPQTFSGNTPWYYTPIKILSYRPVMGE